ncbi:MAG: two-component regulator propeller domain-containing protein [Bacteroidia bacterium]
MSWWVGLGLVWAQGMVPVGQWGVYAYHGYITRLGYLAPYFWCLSAEGIILLDPNTATRRELNRTNGLLRSRPTALYTDLAEKWVFLGYEDGHVQFGRGPEDLQVLSDIAMNPFYSAKAVRDFYAYRDTVAIATDFGLVFWHRRQRRILGAVTQFPGGAFGEPVLRVWWAEGFWWAFAQSGLYAASAATPLGLAWRKRSGPTLPIRDDPQDFRGWASTPQGLLIAYRDSVFRWAQGQWVYHPLPPPLTGRRVQAIGGEGSWGVSADTNLAFFFSPQGTYRMMWNPDAQVVWSSPTADEIALGSAWAGAYVATPTASMISIATDKLCGSAITEVVPTQEGLFFIHAGAGFWGMDWGSLITFYPFGAPAGRPLDLVRLTGKYFYGFSEAAWAHNYLWVAAANGLLRLRPEGTVDTFTAYNAPMDGVIQDNAGRPTYFNYTALAVARDGTIWVGKRFGQRNLLVFLPAQQRWIDLPYTDGPVAGIQVDRRGYKWVLYEGGAIRVIDDQGRPEDLAAYRSVLLGTRGLPLPNLPSPNIRVLAPDRKGAIWLGTDKGIAVLHGDPFQGTLSVSRPVVNNRYLLEEEVITAIAVDGHNRKWIGTENNGVYVVSADGLREIATFNVDNSPLPNNKIYRIRCWDAVGEVFLITAQGTVSYRDWATDPSESLDTLHIFPNPVSRRFEGWVGIRGLSEGSTVRIFTPDGEVIRYLQAFGGQAVWDLRTLSGHKVSAGIYLIGALDAEGKRSALSKIVVMD